MSNPDVKLPEYVDVTPNWIQLFKYAEGLLKASDMEGKAFVLEMFQYGMRCYEAIEKKKDYA
jgi:hypothetical protein